MKYGVDWNSEEELFENITEALCVADPFGDAFDVQASAEQGEYGENGYITIITNKGKFRLELSKIA